MHGRWTRSRVGVLGGAWQRMSGDRQAADLRLHHPHVLSPRDSAHADVTRLPLVLSTYYLPSVSLLYVPLHLYCSDTVSNLA